MELKFLKKSDFDKYEKMDGGFLLAIDFILSKVDIPIEINNSYRNTHTYHGRDERCRAIDFRPVDHSVNTTFKLASDIYRIAKEDNIVIGLGLYPYWNVFGLHIDNGYRSKLRSPGKSQYWYRTKSGSYKYSLDFGVPYEKVSQILRGK